MLSGVSIPVHCVGQDGRFISFWYFLSFLLGRSKNCSVVKWNHGFLSGVLDGGTYLQTGLNLESAGVGHIQESCRVMYEDPVAAPSAVGSVKGFTLHSTLWPSGHLHSVCIGCAVLRPGSWQVSVQELRSADLTHFRGCAGQLCALPKLTKNVAEWSGPTVVIEHSK